MAGFPIFFFFFFFAVPENEIAKWSVEELY
jgi:hypothetical protein